MPTAPIRRQRLSDIAFLGDLQWDPSYVDACLDELLPVAVLRRPPPSALATSENGEGKEDAVATEQRPHEQTTPARAPSRVVESAVHKSSSSGSNSKLVDASVQTAATETCASSAEDYAGTICTISYPLESTATCLRIIETLIEEEVGEGGATTSYDAAVANDLDQRLEAIKVFRRVLHNRVIRSGSVASIQQQAGQVEDAGS